MSDVITGLKDDDIGTTWTTRSEVAQADDDATDPGDADGDDADGTDGDDADGTDGGDADGTDA